MPEFKEEFTFKKTKTKFVSVNASLKFTFNNITFG